MATKLIVGLGNPDTEYEQTRHNLGTMFIDYLAKEADVEFSEDQKTGALVAKTKVDIGGKTTTAVLVKPQSYVNVTGPVVMNLAKAFKVKPADTIIVQDDLDIPFGNIKLSFDKNSGGHRGIESIMKSLKTKAFFRLRLGIANTALAKAYRQPKTKDDAIKKFVLAKFTPTETASVKKTFKAATELLASPGTQLAQ